MSDATDSTLNGYNGTATNVNFNVAGKFGNAGEFNGLATGGSIITTSSSAMQLQNLSVSAWINMSALNTLNIIATSAVVTIAGDFGWSFAAGTNIENGLKFVSNIGGSLGYQTVPYSFSLNTWYHVAFTRNSSGLVTFYVNGSSIGTSTRAGSIVYTNNPTFSIGATKQSTNIYWTMPGKIDQVRIFPSALTADNVTSLYNEVQCVPAIIPSDYFNPVFHKIAKLC